MPDAQPQTGEVGSTTHALLQMLSAGRGEYLALLEKHLGRRDPVVSRMLGDAFDAGAKWGACATVSDVLENGATPLDAATRILRAADELAS